MASFITNNNNKIHLTHCHFFGRLSNAVETYIMDPFVSRIHFSIEHYQNNWFIIDNSRNGTWLNKIKMISNHKQLIKKGDLISCGENQSITFLMEDDSPPKDLLCQKDASDSHFNETIQLDNINHFSDTDNRIISIIKTGEEWKVQGHQEVSSISNQEWIDISNKKWQLLSPDLTQHTVEMHNETIVIDEISLCINTNLNEESNHCALHTPIGNFDLKVRSHHYLILLLARQLASDYDNNLDTSECGWLYLDTLMTLTRLPETQINILIYRARKQFTDSVGNLIASDLFIQRRQGQVRLGIQKIEITKGSTIEYSSTTKIILPV